MIFIIFCILSLLLALYFNRCKKGYSALSIYLTGIAIILFNYFTLVCLEFLFKKTFLQEIILWLKYGYHCFNALLIVMFIIAEIPVIIYSNKRQKANSNYAIVLGAGVDNGKPSKVLTQRIQATKEFLDTYPQTIAILSGGKVEDANLSEAECIKNELIKFGINEDRLILEDQSKNTVENFKHAKELLNGVLEVTIITSDTHLYRSCYLARKVGLKPSPYCAKNTIPILKLSTSLKEAVALWDQWLLKNKKHGN